MISDSVASLQSDSGMHVIIATSILEKQYFIFNWFRLSIENTTCGENKCWFIIEWSGKHEIYKIHILVSFFCSSHGA